jgi:hypothetical protein
MRITVLVIGLVAAALAPATARADESVAAAVLRAHVHALARPVHTYHYLVRHRLGLPAEGYVAPDHPGVEPYLRMKVARYWDLGIPTRPYATASGLYLATDPVISRAFGGVGDVWAMIQVPLAAGFRYVDVRRSAGGRAGQGLLPAAARRELAARGCEVEYADTLLIALESSACRRAAVQVLQELGVEGILYDFQRGRFSGCDQRPQGGFIVLDARALGPAKLFVKESAADVASADRAMIRELFRRAREAGSRRIPPWPELGGAPPRGDVDRWMAAHLFGCGPHPEDRGTQW